MKKTALVIAVALAIVGCSKKKAHAFNLWQDVQDKTNWDVGKAASGGTAIALKHNDALNVNTGDFVPSALAELSDYRFISAWAGGNQYKLTDGSTVWKDAWKVGINLAYFLQGFKNAPPAILNNLIIGPSISGNLLTSPHVFVPFLDVNYSFGGSAPPAK